METETKEKHITEIETSTSCCKPEPIRHKKTRRGMNTEIVNKIERRSFRQRSFRKRLQSVRKRLEVILQTL